MVQGTTSAQERRMNTKKRKLNRGLDALLGTDLTKKAPAGTAEASTISPGDGDLRQLPLEFLHAVNISLELTLMKPRYKSWPTALKPKASCSRLL